MKRFLVSQVRRVRVTREIEAETALEAIGHFERNQPKLGAGVQFDDRPGVRVPKIEEIARPDASLPRGH